MNIYNNANLIIIAMINHNDLAAHGIDGEQPFSGKLLGICSPTSLTRFINLNLHAQGLNARAYILNTRLKHQLFCI
jgi:hypothetical protein